MSQTAVPWQGTHRLPGLVCAETRGKPEFLDPEPTLCVLQEVSAGPGDFEGRATMQRMHHLGAFALHPSLAKEVMERHAVGCDVAVGWGHVSLPQILTRGRVEHFQPPTHLFPPEHLPPRDTR